MGSSYTPAIATPVTPPNGGTGVANNASSTLTISGNFGTTITVSGATTVTLPTTGTLLSNTTQIITTLTTEQLRLRYDASNYLSTTVNASGVVVWNSLSNLDYQWAFGGTTYLRFGNNALTMSLPAGGFFLDSNGNPAAGRSRFSVSGTADSGPGLSDGGGTATLGFCIGGTDKVVLTATALTSAVLVKVPGGVNPILTTTSAITSGAGAQLGTITNSPVAGNPTKWVPVDDNGTIRYSPLW